jgi:sulfoxide reductase heme-binding subunit YedZ
MSHLKVAIAAAWSRRAFSVDNHSQQAKGLLMANPLKSVLNSKAFLWALLAIPAVLMLRADLTAADIWPGDLLHPSGEWSARLIIFALMLTPLSMIFRGRRWIQWLLRRRRAFGVAGFAYALLHLLFYLLDMESVANILAEIGAIGIWTGWVAFFLFLPLALTSNDRSMRALKAGWKRVQRLAYPAAILTLVHWMFVHDDVLAALVNFAPLAALELWRSFYLIRARTARQSSVPLTTT